MDTSEKLTQSKWTGRFFQWITLAGLSLVPILNLVLLRGWRVKIVENMGKSKYFFKPKGSQEHLMDFIKSIMNLPVFFLKGAILWIAHWIYWIPLVVFFLIFGIEFFTTFWNVLTLIVKSVLGFNGESVNEVMNANKNNFLVIIFSVVVYYFIYWPIFRAGMVRYSVEGKVRYLFQISKNIKFAQRYFKFFLTACIYATLVELILFNLIIGISLFIPFISYILVFVILLPAIYATTGYIYGTLARKIYKPSA